MPPIQYTVRSERAVAGGRRIAVALHDDERVPALLLLPDVPAPAPAALLLHGLTSRKEQMADTVGRALLGHGIASLAIDLPLHGEREGTLQELSARNPLGLVRRWRLALQESRVALRALGEHDEVDAQRLALVGYSLGAYLGVSVAARERAVRAMVLAAGGDLPAETPFASLVRSVADPLRAVRAFAGRPLLMVNGRHDRTIRPDQAERLFAAAGEPKAIRWWDAGHWLPQAAIEEAAGWMDARMRSAERGHRAAR